MSIHNQSVVPQPRTAISTIVLFPLFLAVMTFLLYLPTRAYTWVDFDDNLYVTENHFVASGLHFRNFIWAFTHFHMGYWIPLTWISHMIDCQLWGIDPGPPHLVNAVFHAVNSALVFLFLLRTTGAVWRSGLVAALFAWHPLHVESVAWLAERKDVLSTLFWLLASVAYVEWTRTRRLRTYCAVLFLFLAGLTSKPSVVTLPICLLLLDFWPLRRLGTTAVHPGQTTITKALLEKLPLFAMSLGFAVLTVMTQSRKGALSDLRQLSLSFRLANALVSYVKYLMKTICPIDLAGFYPLPANIPFWHTALAGLLLAAATVFVVQQRQARPYLFVGWSWFLVTLLPMIGIFQAGIQAMADRFSYIPLLGIFIMIAWLLGELVLGFPRLKITMAAAVAVALCICLVLTSRQMRQWRTPSALFSRILEIVGPAPLVNEHLGTIAFAEGRMETAIEQFRAVLQLNPTYPDGHTNLGAALFRAGHHDEGLAELEEALRINPTRSAFNNYGNVMLTLKRFAEAKDSFAQAVQLDPDSPIARNNMGVALLKLGEKQAAAQQFREAIRLNPEFETAKINLASCLEEAQ
jgi:tetratricopeptide (TPR) repeat protein